MTIPKQYNIRVLMLRYLIYNFLTSLLGLATERDVMRFTNLNPISYMQMI